MRMQRLAPNSGPRCGLRSAVTGCSAQGGAVEFGASKGRFLEPPGSQDPPGGGRAGSAGDWYRPAASAARYCSAVTVA
jgi:hypothetical protein